MVVVYVEEFEILDGVELDGEDVVGEVADVAGVEDAEVLAGLSSGEVLVGRDNEGEAVAAELRVLGDDGEGEGGGEGGGGGGGVFELEGRRVE